MNRLASIAIGVAALLSVWIYRGGLSDLIDRNFRAGFDETGAEKADPKNDFSGKWKLVAEILPDGNRQLSDEIYVLELLEGRMSKYGQDGEQLETFQVWIFDDGTIRKIDSKTGKGTAIGSMEKRGRGATEELHFIDPAKKYLIFSRSED